MPRLLFASLPASLSSTTLKSLLSAPPPGIAPPSPVPTDVKLLTTKEGRSRRMAFVGLKTQADAEWVLDKWQGVWMEGDGGKGGGRISVEWAKTVKEARDEQNHRPSKRRKLSPHRSVPIADTPKQKEAKPADPRFEEFMSVNKARAGRSLVQDILDDTDRASQPASAIASVPKAPQEAEVKASSEPVAVLEEDKPRDEIIDDEAVSDLEYMRRRMKRTLTEVQESAPSADPPARDWVQDEDNDEAPAPLNVAAQSAPEPVPEPQPVEAPEQTPEDTNTAAVLASGRLFVRNLPYSVTQVDLEPLFSSFGLVSQVHLPQDASGRPKGFAYVTFDDSKQAVEALQGLDQTDFQGRLIHVMPAVTRGVAEAVNGIAPTPTTGEKSAVKKAREEKRKSEATKEWNWASLYMNSDAVANSVAARLNVSKAELFDPTSDNAAVKLAIAETSVIVETKKYLEDQGINTDAFSSLSRGRSPTTLLVKNIPFGTSEATLHGMFATHGSVARVIVPPAGTMAIVEMEKAEDAKSAFQTLSYKRMGNAVVYLEKGPKDLWSIRPVAQTKPAESVEQAEKDVDQQGEPGSTLFIKNLAFVTTTATLASTFRNLTDFMFARVQTKPNPRRPDDADARLSMGFGFVGFRTSEAAQGAMKAMSGHMLDGHALQIQFAQRGKEEEERGTRTKTKGTSGSASSSKLIIKNVPFETSKKELRELFGTYGTLKSVRLPKKFDRSARGFAFVEYISRKEAEQAMATLQHTHLLGRHLVCQYADDDNEDLDALRLKSGAHLLKEGGPTKRKKFQGLGLEDGVAED